MPRNEVRTRATGLRRYNFLPDHDADPRRFTYFDRLPQHAEVLLIWPGDSCQSSLHLDRFVSSSSSSSSSICVPARRRRPAIRSRCPIHWARTCAARHTRRRRPGTPGAACPARGSHQCPTLPASQSLGVGRWHKPAPKAPQWSDCRLAQGITTMHVSACRLSECHSTKMLSFLMNHSARSSSVSSSSRAIPSK